MKLTDKVFMTFKYIFVHYKNYDWYLKTDDDTFIFMDNLREFLNTKNESQPVTYGYDFGMIVQNGYHSGGAGYVLSKEAFKRLGAQLNVDYKFCPVSGYEDVDVAACLRLLDVYPNKSLDDLGRERFHPLDIYTHYFNVSPWLYSYAANPIQTGLNCCSDSSISFHYMKPNDITKLTNILESKNSIAKGRQLTFKDIIENMLS